MMPQHARTRFYDLPLELQEHILRRRYAWIVLGRLLKPPLRRWREFIRLRLNARRCWISRRLRENIERRGIDMMLETDFYPSPESRRLLPISQNIPCRAQAQYSKDERFATPSVTRGSLLPASRQELHRAMFGSDLPSRGNRRGRKGKR